MSLTLADINALREGARNPIPVGELPHIVKLALQLRGPLVHLSAQSLEHIGERHPDVTDYDLLLIPFAIRHGLLLRDRKKKNVIVASYAEPMSHRRFVAIMKIASGDCEVWLSSFYRTAKRQTKRFVEKSEILKRHD